MSAQTGPSVVVLDHGVGNVHSVARMLEHLGARVAVSADRSRVLAADGLIVPGVGNFHACMDALDAVEGAYLVDERLAGSRAVFGICVGMQVMFEGSDEPSDGSAREGLGQWPGTVTRLDAPVVPHVGWSPVQVAEGSTLFAGVEGERFYFTHSYGVAEWTLEPHGPFQVVAPRVSWARHGAPFVAAVENGPLVATQFHPETSGDAGARLMSNWLATL